jgi:subtilisin family serine protease
VAQSSIWAEKVLPASGTGGSWDDLASGITHATDNDVDIISMSLGGYQYSNLVDTACTYAWNHGILLVAAAGNDKANLDTDPFYPACYNTVIAVSATNSADQRWWEPSPSPWGSNYGNKIELAAPGESVYSTVLSNTYGYKTGTSMACPHVAGLAALLLSYRPTLTNDELRNSLHATVDDLGTPGKDTYYGYGRINAEKAITFPRPENPATFKTVGAIPTKLAVYRGPSSIPAVAGNYYCIFVQLQDAGGNPAYAPAGGIGINNDKRTTQPRTGNTANHIHLLQIPNQTSTWKLARTQILIPFRFRTFMVLQ